MIDIIFLYSSAETFTFQQAVFHLNWVVGQCSMLVSPWVHSPYVWPSQPLVWSSITYQFLFAAGCWTCCSWLSFTLGPFDHIQRFVHRQARLMGHVLLNLVPDGDLKTLQRIREEVMFKCKPPKKGWEKTQLCSWHLSHLLQLLLLHHMSLLRSNNPPFIKKNNTFLDAITNHLSNQSSRLRSDGP